MFRSNRPRLASTLVALVLVAGCGTSTPTTSKTVPTTPAGPPVVKVSTTSLGPTLTDTAGFTLYVSDTDPDGEVTCLNSICAVLFRAMRVPTKSVSVGPGIDGSKFTTIKLPNGELVAAVNGRALYRFRNDKRPGQVLGNSYVNVWHAVRPSGVAFAKV